MAILGGIDIHRSQLPTGVPRGDHTRENIMSRSIGAPRLRNKFGRPHPGTPSSCSQRTGASTLPRCARQPPPADRLGGGAESSCSPSLPRWDQGSSGGRGRHQDRPPSQVLVRRKGDIRPRSVVLTRHCHFEFDPYRVSIRSGLDRRRVRR